MEKIFNLNIDTKDKKIMDIRGLKQFDNNSVLYINITQNSVCFDLTNCTVRINFLKEDKEVLLYMADIIDAKKGKIKIKLSTQILKNPGLVKVDLSIFDKNIMKITSLDFTMQVEKSTYANEYYLQRADFDIVQSMHIEEEKRLKNERDRIATEAKRNTDETTRTDSENTRIDNEKKRIAEWNSVKKDATNIKNTLDNTVSTANKTKNSLQNTISNGDKLKQELTPQNYVKNVEYEKHKKEVTSQYEEITKELKENATKTISKETNIINLENGIGGIANVEIGGNTVRNIFKSANKFNQYEKSKLFCTVGKVNLKPNTTYSQILLGWQDGILQFGGHSGSSDEEWVAPYVNSPCSVFKTPSVIKKDTWCPHIKSEKISVEDMKKNADDDIFKVMILEGDWSNKPIMFFFNGIQAFGGLTKNQVNVTSCGKNLFETKDLTSHYLNDNGGLGKLEYLNDGIELYGKAHYCKTISVKPYTNYVLSCSKENFSHIWIGSPSSIGSITIYNSNSEINFNTGCRTSIIISFISWVDDKNRKTYFKNIQLEKGDKATQYEPYIEDKVIYTLKEPLRGLPNDTRDTINIDGTITRRVGKIVLNENQNWLYSTNEYTNTVMFAIKDFAKCNEKEITNLTCENFANEVIYSKDEEGIYSSVSGILYLRIKKSKLSKEESVVGLKKWLSKNPTTVLYELKEPTTEATGQPLVLNTFKNGSIQVNTAIPPILNVKYPSNINSRINSVEKANSYMKDNLGGAWRTLLILADKELKMKSIKTLSTETNADLKNKINEMIGAWK